MLKYLLGAGAIAVGAVGITAVKVARAEGRSLDPQSVVPADAIVVFGAETLPSGPTRELRSRLDHAGMLLQSGVAPYVVVTGGIDGDRDEVAAMRNYLTERGVHPIVEARPGQNTRQSLGAVSCLRDAPRSIIAVTSAYHAHRVEAEARRHGIRASTSAPDDSPELLHGRTHLVRQATEVVACMVYALPAPVAHGLRVLLGRTRHTLPLRLAGR